ncbi:MAG: hypothetical protein GVY26_01000, partial [Bacteroidetes bacterium]|nr:hypothetical protein [Bacteroidota bacterium]
MTATQKYSQLFQFLRAFYQLRETTVTDFQTSKRYKEVINVHKTMPLPGLKSMLVEKDKSIEEPIILRVPRPTPPTSPIQPEIPSEAEIWFEGDLFGTSEAPEKRASIQIDETEKRFEELSEEEEELILEVEKQLSVWRLQEQE